jgi:hypothetical protein
MDERRDSELRERAIERIARRRRFQVHAVAYVVGGIFLIVVWAVTEYHNAGGWPTGLRTGRMNRDWDPWIIYPLLAGTLALATHGWMAFGREPATEREIAREVERLRSST